MASVLRYIRSTPGVGLASTAALEQAAERGGGNTTVLPEQLSRFVTSTAQIVAEGHPSQPRVFVCTISSGFCEAETLPVNKCINSVLIVY